MCGASASSNKKRERRNTKGIPCSRSRTAVTGCDLQQKGTMYSSQHRSSPERVPIKSEIKRQVAGYVSTAPIGSPTGGHHHYDYASPPGSAAQKLGHVAERFSSFYNDLESEKQHRRDTDAQRRAALTEAVQKLERSLDAEIKRRAESDKSIQMSLEAEIKAVHEKLANQIREQNLQLKASIDALSRTFAELHGQLREEKEQRRVDLEHLTQTIGQKVEEAHSGLDDERVARLEREAQTLKRVGEDVFRVQEKIDAERATREAALEMLQREVRDSMTAHNESEESFQHMVLDDIATLKNQMLVEREERMSEDEQIVQAINDYTKALQDGLRIVNT